MKTRTDLPLPETYGYHIIQTPEDRERFKPKLSTDECLHHGKWLLVGPLDSFFNSRDIYRRRIDVGEGWRLVELEEEIKDGDEAFLPERNAWVKLENKDYFTQVEIVLSRDYAKGLSFRRRVEVKSDAIVESDSIKLLKRIQGLSPCRSGMNYTIAGMGSGLQRRLPFSSMSKADGVNGLGLCFFFK